MSDKEAVEAVAQALAEVDGHNWTNPGCENKEDDKALRKHYRIVARIAVNIARPYILEEAARIADERESYWNEFAYDTRQAGMDDSFACASASSAWRIAATIRAAKETGE